MAEEFKVLTDREHVLKRSGVYLGAIVSEPITGVIDYKLQTLYVVPGLIKCIEEIYQNSIDEYIRTNGIFASNISISVAHTIDGVEITVTDDGRGIPQDLLNGTPKAVLALTELRAGSNFDDTKRVTAGTNGMGSSLVNIFSSSFKAVTCDGINTLNLLCSDNMQNINFNIAKTGKSKSSGTTITFTPDLERFGLSEFTDDHSKMISDRITNLAIMYPGINFKFNSKDVKFKNLKSVAKQFHTDAVVYESDLDAIVFAPSGDTEEFICHSYVNGIYNKNGGSHVDYILWKVSDALRVIIKRKHKIEVLPNQIKQHLLLATWLREFPNLKFDSQTKERITNSFSEMNTRFSNVDFDKIAKMIASTPAIIDPMIAAILYKKEMAEKRELASKLKQAAKIRVVNHIAATDPNPENRILCIAEGLSAISMLVATRDAKKIGGYPLKGKVLNVRGMKPVEIVKNKEIRELLTIIGLEFGVPAKNLNYGKIGIMTDSDVDGAAIFCLLLNLFSHWPELYDQNRICRIMTPLYVCTKGKVMKQFYTKEEFDKFDSKGYDVSYLKGLGTMSKEMYKQSITEMNLLTVTAADKADYDKLEMAFGDSAELRKEWMMK